MVTIMNIQIYDTAALGALGSYVEKITYYEDFSYEAGLKLLPNPHCYITISLAGKSSDAFRLNGKRLSSATSFGKIATMQTEPIVCGEIRDNTAVGIYLKPYAMRAIGGMRPVANMVLDAEKCITGIVELRTALQQAKSADRLEITKQFFEAKIQPLSIVALRRLEAVCTEFANGQTDLDKISEKLGVSKRSIHDMVVRYAAVNPKTLAHIYTFSRLVDCINRSDRPIHWPSIVESLGLYDQSHLIKVFKKMTGLTPTQWYSSVEFSGYPADEWIRPIDTCKA